MGKCYSGTWDFKLKVNFISDLVMSQYLILRDMHSALYAFDYLTNTQTARHNRQRHFGYGISPSIFQKRLPSMTFRRPQTITPDLGTSIVGVMNLFSLPSRVARLCACFTTRACCHWGFYNSWIHYATMAWCYEDFHNSWTCYAARASFGAGGLPTLFPDWAFVC